MKFRRLSLAGSGLLIAAAVTLKLLAPAAITDLQNRSFDLYQQLKPRLYESAPVRIVDIDDATLERAGQWPWPRTQLAALVEKLQRAGASVIAFDAVFAEPDRTSPQQIVPLWGRQPALRDVLSKLPDHDALFAEAIASAPVVTGFVLTHGGGAAPALKAGWAVVGNDPSAFVPSFSGSVTTLPQLEAVARGNGALNSTPDGDGILRHLPLVMRLNGQLYPSLAVEALRVAQGADSYVIKSVGASGEEGSTSGIVALKIADIVIPTDQNGSQWLYYSASVEERSVPAWQVLDGTADPSRLAGHIILVGTSAAGLKDIRATPLNPAAPGVEVFAQALEQAILGITLSRPDWMAGAEILLMVAASLLLLGVNALLTPLAGIVFMAVTLGGILTLSWHAFASHRLLVEPVMPALTIVVVYILDVVVRYIHTERERTHIRTAFSQYMSPALVRELANHPERLTLGGENRPLSVMFCDMRGFTSVSERLPPQELTRLLSRFLTPITQIILDRQGTIDKYIGDCVMAFWNAPLDDGAHARHAVLAALGIQEALNRLNAEREAAPLQASIGINTDLCCVGNMGTDQRFNYSALGDGVNLASRLQAQCRHYGVDIILGENTEKEIRGMACLELDLIRVQGREALARTYTLVGDERMAESAAFSALAERHRLLTDAYRGGQWDQAERVRKDCVSAAESLPSLRKSGLYTRFARRIALLRNSMPDGCWDGVYDAREK